MPKRTIHPLRESFNFLEAKYAPYLPILCVDGPDMIGKSMFCENLAHWLKDNVYTGKKESVIHLSTDYRSMTSVRSVSEVLGHMATWNRDISERAKNALESNVKMVVVEGWLGAVINRLIYISGFKDTYPEVSHWLRHFQTDIRPFCTFYLYTSDNGFLNRLERMPDMEANRVRSTVNFYKENIYNDFLNAEGEVGPKEQKDLDNFNISFVNVREVLRRPFSSKEYYELNLKQGIHELSRTATRVESMVRGFTWDEDVGNFLKKRRPGVHVHTPEEQGKPN